MIFFKKISINIFYTDWDWNGVEFIKVNMFQRKVQMDQELRKHFQDQIEFQVVFTREKYFLLKNNLIDFTF